jgi:hypothetical protein
VPVRSLVGCEQVTLAKGDFASFFGLQGEIIRDYELGMSSEEEIRRGKGLKEEKRTLKAEVRCWYAAKVSHLKVEFAAVNESLKKTKKELSDQRKSEIR